MSGLGNSESLWVGHSREILVGLGTPGRLWGWALQRDAVGLGLWLGHSLSLELGTPVVGDSEVGHSRRVSGVGHCREFLGLGTPSRPGEEKFLRARRRVPGKEKS